ncbi:MAG TPA: class I adenylate-forming enzyme family protein [Thermoanaerobaculia bacterium]|jgi:long-chain acyl-CoA synthetase|nr:class I adenylate-forming enzyme family protein [Thermoanaerobaculia bacterium]
MLQRFLDLASAGPDFPALIDADSGHVTTRAALRVRAEELAAQLAGAGLAAGELVAIQLPNSVDFVAAFLAVLMLRLIAVPIDRDAPSTEVGAILSHFAIKGFLYRGGISTRAVQSQPVLPKEARLIKLTSGSTGTPKGIVTSEANLAADCTNICSTMDIRPQDRNLGAIPMSHSYGFSNLVTPLLMQGTAVVVSNDYLPQSLLDLANRERCTVVPAIPMVFEHLTIAAKGDFHTVRTFLSAGAPLPAQTSRRFRERFGLPIHTFYGCSECGGITYDRAGAAVERGTAGAAMEGVELSLDPKTQRLGVRGGSVALGYLHDASTFKPFESGTFLTDDLVELADGEVVLTGRVGDLINTAGKKVNPREVEAVILQLEGVRQAKVYGEPAGARGEVVAAAIVASPDVTREQVREFCRARLSPHKVPRIVKLIEAIPVDERGKVKRAVLATL